MPIFRKPAAKSNSKPMASIGDAFKSLGNAIVSSSNKTNNEIKHTITSDKAMAGYKSATRIAIGVASLTPLGKAAAMAAITISDKVTGGKATAYLGPSNSTLNMAPGGALFQAIVKEADPNLQNTLNKYDPKKALVKDVTTIGKTAVTHPSQIGNTVKSVAAGNYAAVKHTPAVSSLSKSAASFGPKPKINHPNSKPSIMSAMSAPVHSTIHAKPLPVMKAPMMPPRPQIKHTIKAVTPPGVAAPVYKPTIFETAIVPMVDTPLPVESTLAKNDALHTAVEPSPPLPESSNSSVLPIIGGLAAIAAILLLMKR